MRFFGDEMLFDRGGGRNRETETVTVSNVPPPRCISRSYESSERKTHPLPVEVALEGGGTSLVLTWPDGKVERSARRRVQLIQEFGSTEAAS